MPTPAQDPGFLGKLRPASVDRRRRTQSTINSLVPNGARRVVGFIGPAGLVGCVGYVVRVL